MHWSVRGNHAPKLKYLEKVKGLFTKLDGLPDGSPGRATLQAQFDSCVKNIMTPELQPKKITRQWLSGRLTPGARRYWPTESQPHSIPSKSYV